MGCAGFVVDGTAREVVRPRLLASAIAGDAALVSGKLDTIMAGLA
jgi:hypothetical protein